MLDFNGSKELVGTKLGQNNRAEEHHCLKLWVLYMLRAISAFIFTYKQECLLVPSAPPAYGLMYYLLFNIKDNIWAG